MLPLILTLRRLGIFRAGGRVHRRFGVEQRRSLVVTRCIGAATRRRRLPGSIPAVARRYRLPGSVPAVARRYRLPGSIPAFARWIRRWAGGWRVHVDRRRRGRSAAAYDWLGRLDCGIMFAHRLGWSRRGWACVPAIAGPGRASAARPDTVAAHSRWRGRRCTSIAVCSRWRFVTCACFGGGGSDVLGRPRGTPVGRRDGLWHQ